MKSYSEIAVGFSAVSLRDKDDYLLTLTLDELKLFKDGLPPSGWKGYVEYAYTKRLSEIRNDKLDQLGI